MENNSNTDQEYNILSFKKGFISPNIPIVTLYQGDKEFNFIIDTGSDENIINQSSLKDMAFTPLDDTHSLSGLGGSQTISSCQITMTFQNREFTSKYLMANLEPQFQALKESHGIPVHGMIGSKHLHKYGFVLDFEQLIAYNKKK